jgi:hypothetical protein
MTRGKSRGGGGEGLAGRADLQDTDVITAVNGQR